MQVRLPYVRPCRGRVRENCWEDDPAASPRCLAQSSLGQGGACPFGPFAVMGCASAGAWFQG